MNASPPPDREPLEVELLLPQESRRVTVEEHAEWLATLSRENPAPVDPIDEAVEEGGQE